MKVVKEYLLKEKIVATIRLNDYNNAISLIDKLLTNDIKVIEIAFTNKDASKILKHYRKQNVFIGAGTIINRATAINAITSGALFIVAPNYDYEVHRLCLHNNILYIPGAFTPNEICIILNKGIDLIKLFPGNLGGVNYLKTIKKPLNNVDFMISGGVNVENAKEWLESGASLIAVGSEFENNSQNIELICQKYISLIK